MSRILAASSRVRRGLSLEVCVTDLASSLTACRIKVSRTSFRSFVSNKEMLFMARALEPQNVDDLSLESDDLTSRG